ncbi:immunity protein 52 of polymorphic toxin system [Paraburkholderia caballeronis]|uniref:Imm52 family immunity protein n=1 Tax=Paraburkholderia caballeronis TaxID=416943 RepID=UPI0010E6D718|nr:Imm52 family immunity protein [Paraburkholderia caballeronis]TDV25360.1 immunity protein 52 of polymorphic toxin system [Paraburkholderia caballeronis]
MVDLNVRLLFRIRENNLPTIEEQLKALWLLAKHLENIDLPMEIWHPAAPTPQESLSLGAFHESGPTDEVISLAKSNNHDMPDYPSVGVANGVDGSGGIWFTSSLNLSAISSFDLVAIDIYKLFSFSGVAHLIEELVKIYPALCIEAGPYKYFSDENQVFPDRPGVGWMLYLPHVFTPAQIPEARTLIPVMRDGQQQGTIIVSVTGEVFDVNNRDHVKTANDIEIRLADQDLLPRYVDL